MPKYDFKYFIDRCQVFGAKGSKHNKSLIGVLIIERKKKFIYF